MVLLTVVVSATEVKYCCALAPLRRQLLARRGAVPSFIGSAQASALWRVASTAQYQEAGLCAACFAARTGQGFSLISLLCRMQAAQQHFSARKESLLTSALVQKARVAAEASLKGVGEPPAAPCSAALCGRVPPWSNNYPQQPLDVVTAITLRLSVVVDHTGRALRTKALPLPATFRLYSEFGGYQKAASPRAQALGPCASVWRAPPCNGVSTLSTQH